MDTIAKIKTTAARRRVQQAFEVSKPLFVIGSLLFIVGSAVGLFLDSSSGRIGTFVNTAVAVVINLTAFVLGITGKWSRNPALGVIFYVSGLVFLVESFLHDYSGTELLINYLGNLVIVTAFTAVAGILVNKFASVAMGAVLLAYLVFVGTSVLAQFPQLEDAWLYMIFTVVGLVVMITYYRSQLERLIQDLHQSRESLQRQRDTMESLKIRAEKALEDLTAAQKKIIIQEKLASLGSLTAGIAHEIKNPLNFVTNFSESSVELMNELRENLDDVLPSLDEERRNDIEYLLGELVQNMKDINDHGKRGDRIVKNMLMHSRGGKGNYTREEANVLAEESLHLAYHGLRAQDQEFKADYALELDPEAGATEIVRADLSRVLLNLMNNGFYAANERRLQEAAGGNAGYPAKLTVRTVGELDSVKFIVRDNGTGIEPEKLDQLFTPFFTTKPSGKGTGLGLSISREIVEDEHGGNIEVKSEVGSFTEFTVTVPRQAKTSGTKGGANTERTAESSSGAHA